MPWLGTEMTVCEHFGPITACLEKQPILGLVPLIQPISGEEAGSGRRQRKTRGRRG